MSSGSGALPTRLPLDSVASYGVPTRERAGWLRLDINESPEGAPEFVVRATHDALSSQHIATYPTYAAWREEAAVWFGVPPEWLTCTAGCDEGIKAIFDTFLLPGQALVTQSPGFDMFTIWADLLGNPIRQVNLKAIAPARLVHDDAAWFTALAAGGATAGDFTRAATATTATPPTGLVAVANPNNPAGTAVSRDVVKRTLAAVACPVVIDETYGEFLGESAVDLIADNPHLFVTRSFSKVYGLAGLRIGVVISQPQNIVTLRKVLNPFNVNRAAIAAARACMSRPTVLHDHVAGVRAVRDDFAAQLNALGIATGEAHANFLLVHIGERHGEVVTALEAEGILVRDRHDKHPLMRGCVRIAIGSAGQMARCLGALKKVLTPPPKIHTLLLDMDGTLVDVARSCRQAIIDATSALLAEESGVKVVAGVLGADAIDPALVDSYKARGGLNNDWDCVAAILADRGVDSARQDIIDHYQRSYRGDDFSGSIAAEPWLLSAEKEAEMRTFARIGIVTGRPHAEAQYTLARHGGPWPVVIGMEDMSRQKPAPDGLLAALAALHVTTDSAQTVAYVGDSVDDMQAATAAGHFAIGVLAPGRSWDSGWPERLYEAGAEAVFAHIDEVITWLKP